MTLVLDYQSTRQRTEDICAPLQIEDYIPQIAEFASPPIWHLAHTTWFFEEMILNKNVSDYKEFNPHFNFLFNSYYNSVGKRNLRTKRGAITRPGVQEVYEYRKYVDQHMNKLISNSLENDLRNLITLGINHEQQHQELMYTDLKYVLAHSPIYPVYKKGSNLVNDKNTTNGFISINEGVYEIGHNGEGFHYDNELGKHKAYLQEFEISKSLVTNGDYLEFIEDNGYKKFQYWLDEGLSWVNENQIEAPLYWENIDGEWFYFTLDGLQKVDLEAVLVHISFYEASAYASWKGMRLPTEFEWEVASNQFDWGLRWEWTNSAYLPYPGFEIAEGAVGEYNGKFMVNQMVLRGASIVTAKRHSRPTYRNFFHAQHQWQFTGIRLVK